MTNRNIFDDELFEVDYTMSTHKRGTHSPHFADSHRQAGGQVERQRRGGCDYTRSRLHSDTIDNDQPEDRHFNDVRPWYTGQRQGNQKGIRQFQFRRFEGIFNA